MAIFCYHIQKYICAGIYERFLEFAKLPAKSEWTSFSNKSQRISNSATSSQEGKKTDVESNDVSYVRETRPYRARGIGMIF